jgi:hypothetical protein
MLDRVPPGRYTVAVDPTGSSAVELLGLVTRGCG